MKYSEREKKRKRVIILVYLALILLLFIYLPKIIFTLLPFLLALLLAYAAEPLVSFLEKKAKIPRKISAFISIVIAFGIFGSILGLIIGKIAKEVEELSKSFPSIYDSAERYIKNALQGLSDMYNRLPDQVIERLDELISQLGDNMTSIITNLAKPITNFTIGAAKNVPALIIFVIVLLMSSYFLLADKHLIQKTLADIFSKGSVERLISLKNDIFGALGGYIKAQLILMSITFCELLVGFTIIKNEYAIILALLIAFLDALPIFGTGTVLIPWAIVSLLMKNFQLAFSLLIIYGVCLAVRQILEPKILSTQIGLHPLITLFSLYVGLRLFGVIGMILGPIVAIMIKNVYKSGLFDEIKEIFS